MPSDRINQYFGWGADAKNCAKFYDSSLPIKTSLELAKIMDNFNFPKSCEHIDKCKERKFDEFINVYLLGNDPAPKTIPNSNRSILAIKRALKLKKKLYQCEMFRFPKNQRISYEEWEKQEGQEIYNKRIIEMNDTRKREGKAALKYTEWLAIKIII